MIVDELKGLGCPNFRPSAGAASSSRVNEVRCRRYVTEGGESMSVGQLEILDSHADKRFLHSEFRQDNGHCRFRIALIDLVVDPRGLA